MSPTPAIALENDAREKHLSLSVQMLILLSGKFLKNLAFYENIAGTCPKMQVKEMST